MVAAKVGDARFSPGRAARPTKGRLSRPRMTAAAPTSAQSTRGECARLRGRAQPTGHWRCAERAPSSAPHPDRIYTGPSAAAWVVGERRTPRGGGGLGKGKARPKARSSVKRSRGRGRPSCRHRHGVRSRKGAPAGAPPPPRPAVRSDEHHAAEAPQRQPPTETGVITKRARAH